MTHAKTTIRPHEYGIPVYHRPFPTRKVWCVPHESDVTVMLSICPTLVGVDTNCVSCSSAHSIPHWYKNPLLVIAAAWSPAAAMAFMFHRASIYKYKRNALTTTETSIYFYYINTNEIPGELSRENKISSYVKITCYLHL